ncbi:MAG: Nif11-like leader peptide family natural product precursor [Cyanobacteria bacterium P01_A01_bin.83]
MSKESAIACFIKLRTDKDFEDRVQQAQTRAEREEIIKNAGFDFTDEDWDAAAQESREALDSEEAQELSEEALENVAGGVSISDLIGRNPVGVGAMYGISPFGS